MRLLTQHFFICSVLVYMCFLPNIHDPFYGAFVFLKFIYNMEWNFTLPAHSYLYYTLLWQNQTKTGNFSQMVKPASQV